MKPGVKSEYIWLIFNRCASNQVQNVFRIGSKKYFVMVRILSDWIWQGISLVTSRLKTIHINSDLGLNCNEACIESEYIWLIFNRCASNQVQNVFRIGSKKYFVMVQNLSDWIWQGISIVTSRLKTNHINSDLGLNRNEAWYWIKINLIDF